MFKIIIAGGRDFRNSQAICTALTELTTKLDIHYPHEFEIVSGMATGADMLGYEIAKANGVTVVEFKADWQNMNEPCIVGHNKKGEYNKLAGMNRNKDMAEYGTHLIAFWDGKSKGTEDMIDVMTSLDKPVLVYFYK